MRAGRGKAKGSAFEREICTRLSLWISAGKRKDLLWRSAISGGRATVAHRKGEVLSRVAGDICAIDPEGHELTDRFYFELKFHRDLAIDRFMLMNTGKLARFWKETRQQAQRYKRRPVLIAKQNGMPVLLITENGVVPDMLSGRSIVFHYTIIDSPNEGTTVAVYHLDDVLAFRFARKEGSHAGSKTHRKMSMRALQSHA